jgi:uncharacterized membrane protein YhaH (DUF805 family)
MFRRVFSGRVRRTGFVIGTLMWCGLGLIFIIGAAISFAIFRMILSFVGYEPALSLQVPSHAYAIASGYSTPSPEIMTTRITSASDAIVGIFNLIFFFALMGSMFGIPFLGFLSLGSRRLHDIGYSGWFMIFSIIPLGNIILFFVLLLVPGENKPNRWGPVITDMPIAQVMFG